MDYSWILDFIKIAPDIGAGVLTLLLIVAIYGSLKKQNQAEKSEGNIYELLTLEVQRLSKSLQEADAEILELRMKLQQERRLCDADVRELRQELDQQRQIIQELKDKLIGD